eukprot:6492281-Amphidinium_carterae.1
MVVIQEAGDLWSLLFTVDCFTEEFRAHAFKVLTKACASIFQLYSTSHDKFPVRLFSLLVDGSEAESLSRLPDCVKDPWSQALQAKYGSFGNADVAIVLQAVAQSMKTDISVVECRHASLRRSITMRSVQCWKLGMEMASAFWVLQCWRRHQTRFHAKAAVNLKCLRLVCSRPSFCHEAPKARGKPKTKTCKGGLWRTWVHLQASSKKGRANLHELSVAYREAKLAQGQAWERVVQLAEAVACKGCKMQSPFGVVLKSIKRRCLHQAIVGLWSRISTKSLAEQTHCIEEFSKDTSRFSQCDAVGVARRLHEH